MDPETLATFRAEAEALVESLEAQLLALQSAPEDRALIDGVFRDLHTLKGSGAMFGRDDIAAFLHDFESAFEAVRDGSARIDPDLIEICLAARDHVALLLQETGRAGGEAILARLATHLGKGGGAAPDTPPVPSTSPTPPAQEASEPRHLRFALPADTLSLGGRPQIVLDELRRLGLRNIRARPYDLPGLADLDPTRLHLSWEAEVPPGLPEEEIRGVFLFHEEGLSFELTDPGGSPPDPASEPAKDPATPATDPAGVPATGAVPAPAPEAAARAPSLMRVPAERLDDMMDRVGELVIAEARLVEIASRSGDARLVSVAEDIQRLTTAMRDTTMSIRMTPLAAITGRFRRLVHDLGARLGRQIDFRTRGEETELDKTVVERLTEPLMHIIRNAADHGLEPSETRRAMGKAPRGRIELSARHAGAEVLIALSDDGRGLDRERILRRAIERGLLPEGADPPEEALFALVLEPGFSTAPEVTDLSGRGVGMDVVRRTIEELRGSIDVRSEPGHGTTVTLRLPLTLAIIDGLLIETAGERFVIPLAAVDEIVELPEALASDAGGNAFLDIREALVPFLRLRQLLDSPGTPPPFQKVVVVTSSEGRVGLVVDRIIGSNQTVIKQLSPLHARLRTFSGATLLGDGSVALILDVPQLVQRGRGEAERGKEAA